MKGFGATFRAGFLYLWRDPMSVIILTVFPIVLILVLGNALEGFISSSDAMQPAPIAYVTDGGSDALYAFLTGEESARYVRITPCTRAEAERLLAAGEVAAAIAPTGDGVEVLRASGGQAASVALTLVDAYRRTVAAALVSALDRRDPTATLAADVRVANAALGGRALHAIDYYAVTMLVMILLFAGMNGMSLFNKNMLGEFGMRLQAGPVSRSAVLLATLSAATVTSYLQGLVTFAFTYLVYGVQWGQRVPLVLFTLLLVTLLSQALCVFFLLLLRNEAACSGAVQALIWLSTFVSKGYATIDFGAAERVFQYAPNALAHTVIFGAIYGGDAATMARSLVILIGMILALSLGAFALGRRRLA